MENYIVCEKRGNQPRIHVEICRHRCKDAGACRAFRNYMNNLSETVIEGADAVSLQQTDTVSTRAA
ncbi:MAG: hypothetical protein HWN69_02045 [Desulfobacterales bacterium]|nr:hypothetical protein [Desulfobacterales bacterium]